MSSLRPDFIPLAEAPVLHSLEQILLPDSIVARQIRYGPGYL